MMPVDDVWGRSDGQVFFASRDIMRMMLDAQNPLNASGYAPYHRARDSTNNRTCDFGATMKTVRHPTGHAVTGPSADWCNHQ